MRHETMLDPELEPYATQVIDGTPLDVVMDRIKSDGLSDESIQRFRDSFGSDLKKELKTDPTLGKFARMAQLTQPGSDETPLYDIPLVALKAREAGLDKRSLERFLAVFDPVSMARCVQYRVRCRVRCSE